MSTSASRHTWADALQGDFFERLFEGAGLAIFVIDAAGEVRGANRPAGELVSRFAPGLQQLSELLVSDKRDQLATNLADVIATQEPREFRARIDGDPLETAYAVWLTPVSGGDGGEPRVAVWFHDISEQMALRAAARQDEKLASLGALSGAMAHHYNNLLCCIATNLEYAANVNTMAAMRRALGRTTDAVRRATELTHQLLAFAQTDHSAGDLADLTETLMLFSDDYEAPLAKRGVQLEFTWHRGPILAVPREHLLLVLRNLTENAVDAMPEGGRLRIDLAWEPDAARITIADTGHGMPPGVLERVFEPFYSTRGELAQGSGRRAGMGLAVAHGLIKEMGGTITAENLPAPKNAPGKLYGGACFKVLLPLHPDPAN